MNHRNGYKALIIYQKTFQFAMNIFHLTKKFPEEERYGLTSQIRRSSRSVCANIVEGYRKRIYPKQFVNKLRISDGEASETLLWLEFALACEYISQEQFDKLEQSINEIGYMLASMIKTPEKFAPRKQ
jgi:four helix bundle protein